MIHPDKSSENDSENASHVDRSTVAIGYDDNSDASTSKTNQKPEVDESTDTPVPVHQSIADDSEIKQRIKDTRADAATEISQKPEVDESSDAPIPVHQSIEGDSEVKQRVNDTRVDANTEIIDDASSHHLSKTDLIDDQLFGCPILEATLVEEWAAEDENQGSIHIRIEPSGPVFDAVLVPNESEVQADNHEDDTEEKWPSKLQKPLFVALVLVLVLIIGVVSATTILTKQKPIPPAEDVMDTPEEVIDTSVKEETTFTSTVWSTESTSPAKDFWWTGSTSSTEELVAETFTIEGLMWNDTNADGVHQPSEPFIANAFANLRTCNDDWVQTAWSNQDGHYQFEGVEEGHYYVQFLLPSHRYKYPKDLPSGKSTCKKVHSLQSIDIGYVDRGDIKHEVESILRRNVTINALNQSDSRSKAFNWLLSDDPANLSANDARLKQRYILALLAFEFGDSTYSDWLSGEHECLWDSIVCYGGKVSSWYITGPDVHGTIPPEIAGLTSLVSLEFDDTSLTGTLPTELSELLSLRTLNLMYNGLSGTIPSALGALQSLEWLWLDNNNFTGTLPPELMELTSLEVLSLSENALTGTLPSEIGKLTYLEGLSLDGNEFNGTLPLTLGALQALEFLILGDNEFNGTLPSSLGALQSLEWLALENNNFTGTLPSELMELTSLEAVSLSANVLTGTLPLEIGKLTGLEYLLLDGNEFNGNLPSELQAITQLSWLRIHSNGFTGTLPRWIGEFKHLTNLDVQNNNFTGTFPMEIMSELNLTDFCVKGNNFTEQIPMEIETYDNCTVVYKASII